MLKFIFNRLKKISKIFASLEHLLNEVVETTSKNLAESERNNIKPRQDVTYRTMSYTDKIARKEKLNVNQNLSYRTLCAKDLEKYALKRSENEANYSKNMKYLKHIEVGEFLKKINMAKYEFKFLTNGYDDLCFMVNILDLIISKAYGFLVQHVLKYFYKDNFYGILRFF